MQIRNFTRILLISICIILFALPVSFAQEFLPAKPGGFVNDYANMLSSNEENRLTNKLSTYRDSTTNAFVIATIESLQGYSIEELATTLFNTWDIQYEQRNNGVLILVAEQEREIRIEVGYGLEGAIPDVMADRIIRNIIQPNFRNAEYYKGLNEATSALISLAAGEFEGSPENIGSNDGFDIPPDLIILFLIIFIYLISRKGGGKGGKKHRRALGPHGIIFYGGGFGGGGGSGFGGGGFGGFGGGGGFSSGGGGASGGW